MTTSHRPLNVAVLDGHQGVALVEAVYCRASDNANASIGGFPAPAALRHALRIRRPLGEIREMRNDA